jgi:hypothetical protein
MRSLICALLLTASALTVEAQLPNSPQTPADGPGNIRLPSGKLQRDEILKAEHQKNLEDASELMKLSEDLKIDIEKGDGQVLSLSALKKVDQIEKLAKRIRGRLKR